MSRSLRHQLRPPLPQSGSRRRSIEAGDDTADAELSRGPRNREKKPPGWCCPRCCCCSLGRLRHGPVVAARSSVRLLNQMGDRSSCRLWTAIMDLDTGICQIFLQCRFGNPRGLARGHCARPSVKASVQTIAKPTGTTQSRHAICDVGLLRAARARTATKEQPGSHGSSACRAEPDL